MAKNYIKSRIYDTLIVNGEPLATLFDTGAWNTYLTRSAALRCGVVPQKRKTPLKIALRGKRTVVHEYGVVDGTLQGRPMDL